MNKKSINHGQGNYLANLFSQLRFPRLLKDNGGQIIELKSLKTFEKGNVAFKNSINFNQALEAPFHYLNIITRYYSSSIDIQIQKAN